MEQNNLLIIHHGALGDLVIAFPIIIRLQKIYRQIDALCQIKLGKLAKTLHVVDTYFPLEAASFASLFTDAVSPMVKSILRSYQDILLFSNSLPLEEVISATTGKPVYRIQPRPGNQSNLHITGHLLSQLATFERFGYGDTASHSILLSNVHPDRRDPLYNPLKIVIHPGSGSQKKCWPVANFNKLASAVRSKGRQPVFILGPAEHRLAEALERQDKYQNMVYELDCLSQLVSILKTAGGFVGNDSGVSHLAAYIGLPTIVVFGPSDPVVWRPTGRSVDIMNPGLDCHPCFEINDNHCQEMECFAKTTPEMVLDVLIESISRDQVFDKEKTRN